jgi:hypothetical protein
MWNNFSLMRKYFLSQNFCEFRAFFAIREDEEIFRRETAHFNKLSSVC